MLPNRHRSSRFHIQARPILLASSAALAAALPLAGCRGGDSAPPAAPGESHKEAVRLLHIGSGNGIQMDAEGIRLAGITTAPAGVETLSNSLQPTGEIAATDAGSVQVTSRLPGRIVQTYAATGARVSKGQTLATVDSVDLNQAEAAWQTAKSHADLTSNQLNQARRLAKYGTLSEPQVEDARKTHAAAQAAVNSDTEQIKVDKIALDNTTKLVAMGEITHKPVEDAQNAYAAAHGALVQARVTMNSAKANLDRARILFDGGVFSRQQLEDATTSWSNAVAAADQDTTQEKLAADQLARQTRIYDQNLNGASALQQAQSKLQQDQHTYQNDLTALQLATTQLTRAQAVRRSGIPVNQALQQAEDAYAEAEIALKGAENTLRLYGVAPGQSIVQMANGHVNIPVVSPIDGIVTARIVVPGQLVDSTTALFKVVNLDSVYADAQVFEKDLTSVAVGDPVQVNVAAFPGRSFTGHVSLVGREVNPDTRTILVRTVVRNPGWMLRPGMFASVVIRGKSATRSFAIPADAVLQHDTRQVVYVEVAPGQFVQRVVKVGAASGGRVPVYSGVAPGDKVVVTGSLLLEAEQRKLESEKTTT